MAWKPRLIQGGRLPAVHPSVNTEAPPALELVRSPEPQTPADPRDAGTPPSTTVDDVAGHGPATPPPRRHDRTTSPRIATIHGPESFP